MRHLPIWSLALASICLGFTWGYSESAQSAQPGRTTEQRNQTPGRVHQIPQGPSDFVNPTKKPSKATLDVKCGGNTFTISTGNDQGTCTATPPGSGGGGGGACSDGSGNTASVSCDTGCSGATGSGSCSGP
ncbi:hypothetical protein K9N68_27750 [Kovacikia minuta CCNUW1]|uniref:hypothetical protein n=1 Tax=Kovacikia minuta TaxID=2931930 RepID=UPI001CCF9634|nr:hypothetical protein [Kovacikia minuta]UBF25360.1 hypothetical protein K9N68_27750 [Kovacikia minuta CCNUW1]